MRSGYGCLIHVFDDLGAQMCDRFDKLPDGGDIAGIAVDNEIQAVIFYLVK